MGDDPFGYWIGTHCEAGVSSGCRDGHSAAGEAFEQSARPRGLVLLSLVNHLMH
jgi:hypothetical protein